jgi:hypothetical protein
MLREKFEHKRKAVTGGWRKLHSEDLHSLYSLSNSRVVKSRRMRWAGHVTSVGENRNVKNVLVRKREKETTGRLMCR